MKAMMIEEAPTHYLMQDKGGEFRVPKAELSEEMHAKIRGMAPKKMAMGDMVPQQFSMATPSAFDPSMLQNQNAPPPGAVGPPGASMAPPPAALAVAPPAGASAVSQAAEEQVGAREAFRRQQAADALLAQYQNKPPTEPSQPPSDMRPVSERARRMPAMVLPKDKSDEEYRTGIDEEKKAIQARGEIESETAKQTANVLSAQQDALRRNEQERADKQMNAQFEASEAMKRVKMAQQDLAKTDTSIDPGRYWASRSTPGKIAGIIGLALGAIGAGNDGVNRASALMNQAIDRDLEAQKAEHTFKLQKGEKALEGAQSIYGLTHQMMGDNIAANAAAKSAILERTALDVQRIATASGSPMAIQNAAALSAKARQDAAKYDGVSHARLAEEAHKKTGEAQEWQKLNILGARAAGGLGASPKAQQTMAEVRGFHGDATAALEKAESIIKNYGTAELTGPQQSMLKKALFEYGVASAKLKQPNSDAKLSEIDTELEGLGIKAGDMTGFDSTALAKIANAKKDIDNMAKRKIQAWSGVTASAPNE